MFDLLDNPFVLLDVTPRSTKSQIHEAVEDAMLDAADIEDERRLNVARQALIAPNERLRAELSYLLELRPADARKALATRGSRNWLELARRTEGVARTNALLQAAASCQGSGEGSDAFASMFEAWDHIDERETVARINEARAVGGFVEANHNDVRRGLAELRDYQARRVLEHLATHIRLPALLANVLVEKIIPTGEVASKFPAAVIAAYQKQIGRELAAGADRVIAALDKFVITSSNQAFEEFERALTAWDELAQPLQLASEAKGADDSDSKELYERIREKALYLANDEGRHHHSSKITALAAEVFAELPWAAEAIQKDTSDLNEIIADKARSEFLNPLAAAVNKARKDLPRASYCLRTHGFRDSSPDPIGSIWRGYVGILDLEVKLEVRDLGARIVRSLSIELVNERSDALEAKMITSQLLADRDWFSDELQSQLLADERQVTINLSYQHLKEAASRNDWAGAKQICGELIDIAPASELPELRQMERAFDEKLRSRTTGRVIWGGIAAVILGAVLLDSFQSSDPNSGYDAAVASADTVEMPADEALATSDYSTVVANEGGADEDYLGEESAPPAYGYGPLTLSQVRYCLRQGERLDFARSLVNGGDQQTRFNAAISDFNSRCGSYRYDASDMATAQAELGRLQSRLRSDAQDIVGLNPSAREDYYYIDEGGNLVEPGRPTASASPDLPGRGQPSSGTAASSFPSPPAGEHPPTASEDFLERATGRTPAPGSGDPQTPQPLISRQP